MIDPQERWAQYGEKPDYAGLLTFAGAPLHRGSRPSSRASTWRSSARRWTTSSPTARARASRRARSAAASCPPGPHLEVKVDAFAELRVVDFGDAPVIPADPVTLARRDRGDGRPGARGRRACRSCSAATTRSPSRRVRACAARARAGRASSTSTPTPTPARRCSASSSRTAPSSAASSTTGHVDGAPLRPDRPARLLARARRSSPGRPSAGSRACSCTTSATSASARSSARAIAAVGPGPVYLTVDVDVLDPAFIPGTGTPEPGGMTAVDLLLAVRTVAAELELVGADVVEVIPTGVGTDDYSALVAERVVREALTGIALRRRG